MTAYLRRIHCAWPHHIAKNLKACVHVTKLYVMLEEGGRRKELSETKSETCCIPSGNLNLLPDPTSPDLASYNVTSPHSRHTTTKAKTCVCSRNSRNVDVLPKSAFGHLQDVLFAPGPCTTISHNSSWSHPVAVFSTGTTAGLPVPCLQV